MVVSHHDTVSITQKGYEEYHLYWHASEGTYEDEFICRVYGHVDNAVKVAQLISHMQCEYVSYPVTVKPIEQWEEDYHEGS